MSRILRVHRFHAWDDSLGHPSAGSPLEFSTPDDAAPSGGIPDDGGHFEAQSAGNTEVVSGKASSQSNGVPKQGRATPYNKGSGGGAIRRLRNHTHRREISSNRYSHLLSDLRVAEFIQETASIEPKELPLSMRGQSSSLLKETLQPLAGNDGRPVNPIIPALDAQQCKLNPTAADVVGSAAVSSTPPQQVHNSVNDVPIAPASRTDEIATRVDEDGFTMVFKHNKRGPMKIQSKKQKQVRVKLYSQQNGTGRPRSNYVSNGLGGKQQGGAPMDKQHGTRVEVNKEPSVVPIAPKKVNSGFNYSRDVQGSTSSIRQQRDVTHLVSKPKASRITTSPSARVAHGDGPSKPSSVLGFESANRFSVLDIPTSIKLNKVVEVQDDLYPPGNGLEDSMDLEMNAINSNGKMDTMTNGKYGISETQKQVILNCKHDFKYVQAEAMEEWSQGEWDFFADKCMEMGLDPENSIIYPEEDTEIDDVEDMDGFDSEHAVSHLKKLGSYSDPVMTKSPNRK
ncbi:hypothetical protein L1987_00005 [Smallanthus sonchifolius]|uniref:Uncharacterized protein n=1 Tax=Smallanthus sonchifolius TaxID=185202 RepID=A0ACB9K149_9ASTR|nr:hypothetical protein L1987_00005 [Smallanthus sonchifolius]